MNGCERRVFVATLSAILLSGCGGDPTATKAAKVFVDGFVSDPADAEILEEGGTMVRGYDAWLALKPTRPLEARWASDYVPIACDEPRAFFERVLRASRFPADDGTDCRLYRNPNFDFDHGRWLIEARSGQLVLFRVWKHY